MGSQERKAIIELPVKVILTEVGTTFFINNKKNLRKFKLADNVEEYGILMDRFTPGSLQRMMLIDYVSKVEISNSEFVTIRQEVMDISKLITYSMLYRQYDGYIFQRVLASEVIRNWNRKNPANIIDDKTKTNEAFLQNILKEKEKDIAEIKQSILAPMYAFISKNSSLLPEEKNIQLLLSEKFLNNLRPFIWFIVTKFKGSDGYEALIKDIRTSLAEYMEKAKIAEYVALNIMELATNAENSNLKREAKAIFKGAVDMNSVLFDPNVRRQVIESLKRKGELVYVSWKLGSRGASIGTQGKLQVTIFNKESEYEKMKEAFDEKKSADLRKRS
ncbi:MAG TPA: hypothetical protein PK625_03685, partial [Spirochaetales bacterium]|nr:hypothetical protein [Spirochaetales bacterium]